VGKSSVCDLDRCLISSLVKGGEDVPMFVFDAPDWCVRLPDPNEKRSPKSRGYHMETCDDGSDQGSFRTLPDRRKEKGEDE